MVLSAFVYRHHRVVCTIAQGEKSREKSNKSSGEFEKSRGKNNKSRDQHAKEKIISQEINMQKVGLFTPKSYTFYPEKLDFSP